jgi:hypothetical protein
MTEFHHFVLCLTQNLLLQVLQEIVNQEQFFQVLFNF